MLSPHQVQAAARQHIHRLGQLYATGYFERWEEEVNHRKQEDEDARSFLDWVESNLAEIAALPTPEFRETWSLFLDLADTYYTADDKRRVLRKAKSLHRRIRSISDIMVARQQLENTLGNGLRFPDLRRYQPYLDTQDGGQKYDGVLCYYCNTYAEQRYCARCGSDLAKQRQLGSGLQRRYLDTSRGYATWGGVAFFPMVGLAFLTAQKSPDAFLPIIGVALALASPFLVLMGWYQHKGKHAAREAVRRMKRGDFS